MDDHKQQVKTLNHKNLSFINTGNVKQKFSFHVSWTHPQISIKFIVAARTQARNMLPYDCMSQTTRYIFSSRLKKTKNKKKRGHAQYVNAPSRGRRLVMSTSSETWMPWLLTARNHGWFSALLRGTWCCHCHSSHYG